MIWTTRTMRFRQLPQKLPDQSKAAIKTLQVIESARNKFMLPPQYVGSPCPSYLRQSNQTWMSQEAEECYHTGGITVDSETIAFGITKTSSGITIFIFQHPRLVSPKKVFTLQRPFLLHEKLDLFHLILQHIRGQTGHAAYERTFKNFPSHVYHLPVVRFPKKGSFITTKKVNKSRVVITTTISFVTEPRGTW